MQRPTGSALHLARAAAAARRAAQFRAAGAAPPRRTACAGSAILFAAIIAESLAAAKGRGRARRRRLRAPSLGHRDRGGAQPGAPAVWGRAARQCLLPLRAGQQNRPSRPASPAPPMSPAFDFTVTRVSANSMENRNAIGQFDEADGRVHAPSRRPGAASASRELAGAIFKIRKTASGSSRPMSAAASA